MGKLTMETILESFPEIRYGFRRNGHNQSQIYSEFMSYSANISVYPI